MVGAKEVGLTVGVTGECVGTAVGRDVVAARMAGDDVGALDDFFVGAPVGGCGDVGDGMVGAVLGMAYAGATVGCHVMSKETDCAHALMLSARKSCAAAVAPAIRSVQRVSARRRRAGVSHMTKPVDTRAPNWMQG